MKSYLAPFSIEFVEQANAQLCASGKAAHGRSSDGFSQWVNYWNNKHRDDMALIDMASICRKSHRIAPFLFLNGNTFCAMASNVVSELNIEPQIKAVVEQLVGHVVSGTSNVEEEAALTQLSEEYELSGSISQNNEHSQRGE